MNSSNPEQEPRATTDLSLDELNAHVTEMILTANEFPSPQIFNELSRFEEAIAEKLAIEDRGSDEHQIAQRGAIRAAVICGHNERALVLSERYNIPIDSIQFD